MTAMNSPAVPVPPAALAAMDPDAFAELVRASIGKEAGPDVWDALTAPEVIHRTRLALGAIHADVQNQLSLANAKLEDVNGRDAYFSARAGQAEWRRRAIGFRGLVERRLTFVKSRIPRAPAQQPAGSALTRMRYREALEKLGRAVAAHRDRVLSGEGGEDDDDSLWDHLEAITVPNGRGGEMPLSEWLDWLDDMRAEDASAPRP